MKKRIGEILVESGSVSEDVVQKALQDKEEGQKIGDYFVEKGYVKEDVLTEKLSEQLRIPYLPLADMSFSEDVLSAFEEKLLKEVVAFPIEKTGSLLTVAMADPLDDRGFKKIEDNTDLEVTSVIASKSEILDYIDKYYGIDASMSEFIQVGSKGDRDKNTLQAMNSFYGHLKERKEVMGIIHREKDVLKVKKGYLGVDSNRDVALIRSMLLDKFGLDGNEKGTYKKTEELDDDVFVAFQLTIDEEYGENVYWIAAQLVEKEEKGEVEELKINERLTFVTVDGLDSKEKFIHQIEVMGNRERNVLVWSSAEGFGKSSCVVVDDKRKVITDFISFGDVFVIDRHWIEGAQDAVLSLLNDGKDVIVTLPVRRGLAEEYIKENLAGLKYIEHDIH